MTHQLRVEGIRYFPAETVQAQIEACLAAWGMPSDHVRITATVMIDADQCGNDTHGFALLNTYDTWRREGKLTMDPRIEVVKETPVSVVIDAGGSLGYVPSVTASNLAAAKAKQIGIGAAAVRNSGHFGAAGYYTRLIAAQGLIGLATTTGSGPRAAPTNGKEPKLSTNPIAFAAPAKRNPPFALDMATTTVAAGKIRIRADEKIELPVGWALDHDGLPLTDASEYWYRNGGSLTPLGGSLEGASFKGYGLGVMVEILSAALTGASLVTSPGHGRRIPGSSDIGHFFLAIDPLAFRPSGELEEAVDDLIDSLHDTIPVDPAQPVLVAGDPETTARAERERTGIPVPPGLRERIRGIAEASGASFLLQ